MSGKAESLGQVTDPAAYELPEFARYYDLQRQADGRVFAVYQYGGATVYVHTPKLGAMTMKPKGDAAPNYGVNMPALHEQMPETMTTNDPSFGRATMAVRPRDEPSPSAAAPSPTLILAGAIVVAAFILGLFARHRRGS